MVHLKCGYVYIVADIKLPVNTHLVLLRPYPRVGQCRFDLQPSDLLLQTIKLAKESLTRAVVFECE